MISGGDKNQVYRTADWKKTVIKYNIQSQNNRIYTVNRGEKDI